MKKQTNKKKTDINKIIKTSTKLKTTIKKFQNKNY